MKDIELDETPSSEIACDEPRPNANSSPKHLPCCIEGLDIRVDQSDGGTLDLPPRQFVPLDLAAVVSRGAGLNRQIAK